MQQEFIHCKDLQLPPAPGFAKLCSGMAPQASAFLRLGLVNATFQGECSLE